MFTSSTATSLFYFDLHIHCSNCFPLLFSSSPPPFSFSLLSSYIFSLPLLSCLIVLLRSLPTPLPSFVLVISFICLAFTLLPGFHYSLDFPVILNILSFFSYFIHPPSCFTAYSYRFLAFLFRSFSTFYTYPSSLSGSSTSFVSRTDCKSYCDKNCMSLESHHRVASCLNVLLLLSS